MSRTSRIVALVAVLALPVAALVTTFLLSSPSPPRETPVVRIGESASVTPSRPGAPGTTGESPPTTSSRPSRSQLPPPPPVHDDGDDSDDGQDRDDSADDDD